MAVEHSAVLTSPIDDIRTVAIVGLGLMGGSLGLGLKERCPGLRVLGQARRAETIRDAKAAGMIDEGSVSPADVLAKADLTVLCVPIQASIEFAVENAALWRSGAIVTDVGSVKEAVVDGARPPLQARGVHFIGSHPMAGTEKSSLYEAKADLYDGAVVFLTEVERDNCSALETVGAFWRSLGMEPHRMPPGTHDMLVARTSHVLHLLSFAAARAYLADPAKSVLATGGGFRDFTRIAASSPDMWTQIFRYNSDNVLAALQEFLGEADSLRDMLSDGRWDEMWDYLAESRDSRSAWFEKWQQRRGNGS